MYVYVCCLVIWIRIVNGSQKMKTAVNAFFYRKSCKRLIFRAITKYIPVHIKSMVYKLFQSIYRNIIPLLICKPSDSKQTNTFV